MFHKFDMPFQWFCIQFVVRDQRQVFVLDVNTAKWSFVFIVSLHDLCSCGVVSMMNMLSQTLKEAGLMCLSCCCFCCCVCSKSWHAFCHASWKSIAAKSINEGSSLYGDT